MLFELYHRYLNSIGVSDENIVEVALDEAANARYRNPFELDKYIRECVAGKHEMQYVFIDEIQKIADMQNPYISGSEDKIGFSDMLLGLIKPKNVKYFLRDYFKIYRLS